MKTARAHMRCLRSSTRAPLADPAPHTSGVRLHAVPRACKLLSRPLCKLHAGREHSQWAPEPTTGWCFTVSVVARHQAGVQGSCCLAYVVGTKNIRTWSKKKRQRVCKGIIAPSQLYGILYITTKLRFARVGQSVKPYCQSFHGNVTISPNFWERVVIPFGTLSGLWRCKFSVLSFLSVWSFDYLSF
jgi:hypothetical protein